MQRSKNIISFREDDRVSIINDDASSTLHAENLQHMKGVGNISTRLTVGNKGRLRSVDGVERGMAWEVQDARYAGRGQMSRMSICGLERLWAAAEGIVRARLLNLSSSK